MTPADRRPMRFCPFCAQALEQSDDPDEVAQCSFCGKRLPSTTPLTATPDVPTSGTIALNVEDIVPVGQPTAQPPPTPHQSVAKTVIGLPTWRPDTPRPQRAQPTPNADVDVSASDDISEPEEATKWPHSVIYAGKLWHYKRQLSAACEQAEASWRQAVLHSEKIHVDLGKIVHEQQLMPIDADVQQQIVQLQQRVESLGEQQRRMDGLRQTIGLDYRAVEQQCEQQLSEAKAVIAQTESLLTDKNAALNELHQRLAALQKEARAWMRQRDGKLTQVRSTHDAAQQDLLQQQAAALAIQIGDNQSEQEKIETDIAAQKAPVTTLQATLAQAKAKLSSVQKTLRQAKESLDKQQQLLAEEEARLSSEFADEFAQLNAQWLRIGQAYMANGHSDDAAKSMCDEVLSAVQRVENTHLIHETLRNRMAAVNFSPTLLRQCWLTGGVVIVLVIALLVLWMW